MRIGVVRQGDEAVVAIEENGSWIDFTRAFRVFELAEHQRLGLPIRDILSMLRSEMFDTTTFRSLLDYLRAHRLTENYALQPPHIFELPFRPGKIIAIGRNYLAHAQETGHDAPKEPIFFSKAPTACIGPNQPIVIRNHYGRVDHEAEFAVVIGKTCKDVRLDKARECIAAYSLINDVTAREMQKRDIEAGHPWFRSKSLDTFCPFGPYLVLRESIAWPPLVEISCRVNDEIRQRSNTGLFIYGLPEIIAYVSRYMTLEPGDVIATGTPEGISPLSPGDVVEVCIPEIGVLRNPVNAEM